MKGSFPSICVVAVVSGLYVSTATAAPPKTYRRANHTYIYVPGNFSQAEAFVVAARRGGHPVVFNTLAERRDVVKGLGGTAIAPAWTGISNSLPEGSRDWAG